MKTRCVLSSMVLIAFMLISQPAIADDLADLKAAGEKVFQVWNTGDAEGIFDLWPEDGGIWLSATRAFPITVKKSPQGIQFWSNWFQSHIVQISWYNPQYRIIAGRGIPDRASSLRSAASLPPLPASSMTMSEANRSKRCCWVSCRV